MRIKAGLAAATLPVALVMGAGVAHADRVQCQTSPNGAVWCQDQGVGQYWQPADYGDFSLPPILPADAASPHYGR